MQLMEYWRRTFQHQYIVPTVPCRHAAIEGNTIHQAHILQRLQLAGPDCNAVDIAPRTLAAHNDAHLDRRQAQ